MASSAGGGGSLAMFNRYAAAEYAAELCLFSSCHRSALNIIIHAITIPLEWSATLLLLRSLGGFEAAYISAATVTVYYVLLLQAVKETGLNGPSQEDLSVHSSRDNEYSSSRAIAAGRGYECALAAASVLNLVTMILVADDSAATTAASVLGLDSLLRHDFEALPAVAVFVATQLCSWFLQVCIGHFCIEGSTPSMISRLTINSAILSPALIFHIFLEEVARL